MDYFELIDKIETTLCELSTESALRLITGWFGLRLFDKGFYQYLVDEGVIEDEDEEEV